MNDDLEPLPPDRGHGVTCIQLLVVLAGLCSGFCGLPVLVQGGQWFHAQVVADIELLRPPR